MKKIIKKIIFVALLLGSAALQYYFFGSYNISVDVLSDVVVFLSIVFGFSATSLAIFSTSKFIKRLYKIEDPEDASVTMLHKLVSRYQWGLSISLVSVLYLLLLEFVIQNGSGASLSLSHPLTMSLLPLLVTNFYFGFSLLLNLSQVVIQEGKESD